MHSMLNWLRLTPAAVVLASLSLVISPAKGASVTLNGSTNANISAGVVNLYSPSVYGLIVNAFDPTVAVIEYNISSIPSTAVIDSLTFTFYEWSVANAVSQVNVIGFGDNGTISSSDATASGSLMASYSAVALGLGSHTINLSTSRLQSLVGSGQSFAVRLESGSLDTNTGIDSLADSNPPTLGVTYHLVPEPTALGLLGIGAVAMLRRGRRITR